MAILATNKLLISRSGDAIHGGIDDPEPVIEEEFKSDGQERNPAHDRITKGGAESDHEEPDADSGSLAHKSLMFNGKEEIDNSCQNSYYEYEI